MAGLGLRFILPVQFPALSRILRPHQSTPELLATGMHQPCGIGAQGRLEGDVHPFAGEPLEILLMPQGAVNARRGHFQPLVRHGLNFQHELQLSGHFLAIFHRHKRRVRTFAGPVDGDAQQTSGGALHVHQVIAQARHGLFNRLMKSQSRRCTQNQLNQKKRAVRTRPFGREVGILADKSLICKEFTPEKRSLQRQTGY